ncbi:MAG: hypothetical protein IJP10_05645 [Clostridia bacterium]|nr:hypothetical protein [Clostridia bacterium]
MTDDLQLMRKRFSELSSRASSGGFYTFTDFLTPAQQSLLTSMRNELTAFEFFGGHASCERRIACFGNEGEFGYEPSYPIACIEIAPKNPKFAKPLSHRDYLGAIMSLGIKRETVGDIFQKEQSAYVFCIDSVSDWIISNIESVASVSVRCRLCSEPPEELAGKTKRISVNVASERLDAVIAAVWKLSRTESAKLIAAQKVAVNSLLEENCARVLKPDDTVSVRGYGKFIHRSITGLSKKGRLFAEIDKLV